MANRDDFIEVLPVSAVDALGLDGPHARRVFGGKVSEVWQAGRAGRRVAVRRSPRYRRLDEVEFEHDALNHLADAGAPVARPTGPPRLLDGSVWIAFEWVDGDPEPRPARDPHRYGRLLGELHNIARDVGAGLEQRPTWARTDQFLHHPRGDTSFGGVIDDFARRGGERAARLADLAFEVHARLRGADIDHRPVVLAHGDFGPHQFISNGDGRVVAIVDWDFCRIDLAVTDVAIATAPVRPTMARAVAMLAAYRDVAPLAIADLELLADLRRAFHLNNLANHAVVWANGVDVSSRVAVIDQRLERERWWGPTLLAAARALRNPGVRIPARSTGLLNPEAVTDIEVAHELADRAAVVAMHYFATGVVASPKPDGSPVTEADHAVEVLLREAIAELRAGDAILGEEFGATGESERTWILDPIDGTSFFARGDPNWRIQIALRHDDQITVAVVDAPALGVRWSARLGGGTVETTRDGSGATATRTLRTSTEPAVERSVVAFHPRDVADRVQAATRAAPRSPLPLVDLVRGEIDAFYVDCCQLWDHAPWILIIEEAGGRFTDHTGGHSADRRGGLYSNAAVHEALLAAIRPTESIPSS